MPSIRADKAVTFAPETYDRFPVEVVSSHPVCNCWPLFGWFRRKKDIPRKIRKWSWNFPKLRRCGKSRELSTKESTSTLRRAILRSSVDPRKALQLRSQIESFNNLKEEFEEIRMLFRNEYYKDEDDEFDGFDLNNALSSIESSKMRILTAMGVEDLEVNALKMGGTTAKRMCGGGSGTLENDFLFIDWECLDGEEIRKSIEPTKSLMALLRAPQHQENLSPEEHLFMNISLNAGSGPKMGLQSLTWLEKVRDWLHVMPPSQLEERDRDLRRLNDLLVPRIRKRRFSPKPRKVLNFRNPNIGRKTEEAARRDKRRIPDTLR